MIIILYKYVIINKDFKDTQADIYEIAADYVQDQKSGRRL